MCLCWMAVGKNHHDSVNSILWVSCSRVLALHQAAWWLNLKHKYDCRWASVASGYFNFAKPPSVLSYGVRSKMCLCHGLMSLATGNDTCTHCTSVLGENFCLPLCFKLCLNGCSIEMACRDSCIHACRCKILWPYLVTRGVSQRPVTSLEHKFWRYLIRGIGSIWGHSWSSLATGIVVWLHRQIFFVLRTSGPYKLFNSALHHLSPQRTTSVLLLYSPITELQWISIIYASRVVFGVLNIKF
jgi:hypothetical protein